MKKENTEMTYDTLVEAAMASGASSKEIVSDLATLLKLRQIAHKKNIAKVKDWQTQSMEAWEKVESALSELSDGLHKLEQDICGSIELMEEKSKENSK